MLFKQIKAEIFNKLRVHFFLVFLNKRAQLFRKWPKNQPVRKELRINFMKKF